MFEGSSRVLVLYSRGYLARSYGTYWHSLESSVMVCVAELDQVIVIILKIIFKIAYWIHGDLIVTYV